MYPLHCTNRSKSFYDTTIHAFDRKSKRNSTSLPMYFSPCKEPEKARLNT